LRSVKLRSVSKFGNKKVELCGYKFDSLAEAKHYYYFLRPLEKAGEITRLELQPVFQIEIRGKKICKYRADFQYFDKSAIGPDGQKGALVVVDVKGFRTSIYRLKKRLVEASFPGVKIVEIDANMYRSSKYSLPSAPPAVLK